LEENNLLDEFPKTLAKPAILFGKRTGNFLPAPWHRSQPCIIQRNGRNDCL